MKPPPIRDQSESSQISQSQGFFSKLLEIGKEDSESLVGVAYAALENIEANELLAPSGGRAACRKRSHPEAA
jgi:hypothetical protein